MRTEVDKSYKWGFILSEQDLRRVVQSCHEHAEKINALSTTTITAKLKDGSLVESSNLDDILALENGGHKSITRLTIRHDDDQQPPRSLILLQYENSMLNPSDWNSITLKILGESRDAVFVAAADLEERIKKPRMRSWPYIVSRPAFFAASFLIALLMLVVATAFMSKSSTAVDHLEKQYRTGHFRDPIEAMIFLERERLAGSTSRIFMNLAVSFCVPFFVFGFASAFVPRFSLSYVFYWGDMISHYDKRRNVWRIFWTVVVLGIVASIIGGLILRVF